MTTDLSRPVSVLVVVPLLAMPTQRLALWHGRRLDAGQILYVAIGALLSTHVLTGEAVAALVLAAIGAAALRVVLMARASADAFTLVSFCLWLTCESAVRRLLHNGTITLSPTGDVNKLYAYGLVAVGVAYCLSQLRVGVRLTAAQETPGLLRAYRISVWKPALQFEAASLVLGLVAGRAAAGLVNAFDETTLSLEPQWMMAVGAVSAVRSRFLGVALAALMMALRVGLQLSAARFAGSDLSGIAASVISVVLISMMAVGGGRLR